jgi:hypothetical protein
VRIFLVSSSRLRNSPVGRRAHARRTERLQRVADRDDVVGAVGRDPERVRQRVGPEQLVGLRVALALLVVGLLLGDELHALDVRDLRDQRVDAVDVGRLGVRLEVDVGEHAAPDLVGGARRRLDDRDEHAEHEHGDDDGRRGGERRDGVAAQ